MTEELPSIDSLKERWCKCSQMSFKCCHCVTVNLLKVQVLSVYEKEAEKRIKEYKKKLMSKKRLPLALDIRQERLEWKKVRWVIKQLKGDGKR